MSHSEVIELLGRSRTLSRAERDCQHGTELVHMVERLGTEVLRLQGELNRLGAAEKTETPEWQWLSKALKQVPKP